MAIFIFSYERENELELLLGREALRLVIAFDSVESRKTLVRGQVIY